MALKKGAGQNLGEGDFYPNDDDVDEWPDLDELDTNDGYGYFFY